MISNIIGAFNEIKDIEESGIYTEEIRDSILTSFGVKKEEYIAFLIDLARY